MVRMMMRVMMLVTKMRMMRRRMTIAIPSLLRVWLLLGRVVLRLLRKWLSKRVISRLLRVV